MKEIVVKVSGRIAKYFFGAIREEYYLEMQDALQYCSEDIETVSDLANLIFSLSLDNWNDPTEELYAGISRENLEKFPELTKLVDWIISESPGHHVVIDDMFEYASDDYDMGNISFFEDDSYITVTVDGEEIVQEQKLAEFAESTGGGNIEDNENSPEHLMLNYLIEKNPDFGFNSMEDIYGWNQNQQGAVFINDWFSPKGLDDFAESVDSDRQVTIYFDDITEFEFYTEDDDFDFKNLVFLQYSNAEDFRSSACEQVFNYLFYKGELMDKQENWIRDKGITLTIGKERGFDKLDFLING